MGRYINQTSKGHVGTSYSAKCKALMDDGAILIAKPDKFVPNLVCVINNGIFGAAGYMYNENELKVFTDEHDTRPKTWFIWDKVEKYAG
jgi:hypothetical protein